jgi:hypothetical protein
MKTINILSSSSLSIFVTEVPKMRVISSTYLSVCLFARYKSRTVERIFIKFDVVEFYRNLSTHSNFSQNGTNIMDTYMKIHMRLL